MARKRKLAWWQQIREQPLIAYKLAGAVVAAALGYTATRYGFDLTPEQRELVIWGLLLAFGVDIPVLIAQWRKVSPVAKLERLEREQRFPLAPAPPPVDEEAAKRMGGLG
jgi:hypothetical protein